MFEHPWARVTFAKEVWRIQLARIVAENEIDVPIAGPRTRLGMGAAGTLQEVRAFMELVADVRAHWGRLLTVILIHHEKKGGMVSGAWEGAGDTLLHVQAAGNGHTIVFVQKARWDSERHGKTLHLAWTEGEGFQLEGDRNYLDEITELLEEREWRTVKQISAPEDEGGIGAGERQSERHWMSIQSGSSRAPAMPPRRSAAMLPPLSGRCVQPPTHPTHLVRSQGVRRRVLRCARRTHPHGLGASNGSGHPTQTEFKEWAEQVAERNEDHA